MFSCSRGVTFSLSFWHAAADRVNIVHPDSSGYIIGKQGGSKSSNDPSQLKEQTQYYITYIRTRRFTYIIVRKTSHNNSANSNFKFNFLPSSGSMDSLRAININFLIRPSKNRENFVLKYTQNYTYFSLSITGDVQMVNSENMLK